MSPHIHQRLVAAAAVMILIVFAAGAASAIGREAPDPSTDKANIATFDPQAKIVAPLTTYRIVYVATGANFPDALGAGPAAASREAPILLVGKDSIPEPTRAELTLLQPDEIIIVGGTAVVSPAVETALGAFAARVSRLAGANRYETAAEVTWDAFPATGMMAAYDTSNITEPISSGCSSYSGLSTGISAPGPGTIIVEANVNLLVTHTAGGSHSVSVFIGTSPTDCTHDAGMGGDHTFFYIGPEPSGEYHPWLHLKWMVPVTQAGDYVFYVTGTDSTVPGDTASFYWGYLDVTYFPAPGV